MKFEERLARHLQPWACRFFLRRWQNAEQVVAQGPCATAYRAVLRVGVYLPEWMPEMPFERLEHDAGGRSPLRAKVNYQWTQARDFLVFGLLLSVVSGCAGTMVLKSANNRAFDFDQDTFAYANELDWEYRVDPATGQTIRKQNVPKPEFTHRCFAVSRMARQFFQYAQFDPASPLVADETYRNAVGAVVSRNPGDARRNGKVIIPGYANLRSFSQARESLLKDASGSSWRSYFQFSNWRMIFPFGRTHQESTARQMLDEVNVKRLPIVHLIRFSPFPVTDIDHVIVIFSATETAQEIRFQAYDPNNSGQPVVLTYDRAGRTFIFPTTNYFSDGPVDVYEIYGDELD